jgi:hypothetical protein
MGLDLKTLSYCARLPRDTLPWYSSRTPNLYMPYLQNPKKLFALFSTNKRTTIYTNLQVCVCICTCACV